MPQRTAEQPVLLSRETIAICNRLSSIQHFTRMRVEVAQRLLFLVRISDTETAYAELFSFVDICKQASIAQSHEPPSFVFAAMDACGRLLVL